MKNKVFTLITVGVLFLFGFGSCRQSNSTTTDVDRLPELPADIAATIDPQTMATKTAFSNPAPVRMPDVSLAPCCGSTDTRAVRVKFAYTKCGPLRDFIVAPFGNLNTLASARGPNQPAEHPDLKVFKLTQFNGKTILDQQVCVTSQGPWSGMLTEDRHCVGYTPQQSLVISTSGGPVTFNWSGGVENHPPQVKFVSCRELGTSMYQCNALSTCECISSTCPASQPCSCGIPGVADQ